MNSRKLNIGFSLIIVALWGAMSIPAISASDNSGDKLKFSKKYFSMPNNVGTEDYMSQTVVLKLKEEFRPYCSRDQVSISELELLLKEIDATGIQQRFPFAKRPERETNDYGLKLADLSLIYEFKYEGNFVVEDVINAVYELGLVQYAEPDYIAHLFYTPNDSLISTQWHLSTIKAYQAWDLDKGDTNVVIAIIDSGADLDHPDFIDQFKYNYADNNADGVDDDGDGYIDNYLGWDFDGDDNNTQILGSDHGVHVAGCASPSTDNVDGVAGAGFACKILPIKAGDGGTIAFGYQGIAYAADHGASVINCSWGGPGGGQAGQDVIDYATINNDALVVAAAGNDAVEDLFYPASFNYVLNVASTAQNDTKSGFSNYGYDIDVCAPGSNIYATLNNTYGYNSGTSMASPVAAGCVALVRSYFSNLDALQAGEQLKVMCDDIYPVNNSAYADKLGSGRVNIFAALNNGISKPSIVMTERNTTDGNDEAFVVGDTIQISGIFTNFLAPTGPVTGTLTASSVNVNIVDGSISLGAFGPFGDSKDINTDPLLIEILSGASFNEKVLFELELTDGSYTTSIFFDIIVNVDYINININDVATSITSKSLIGFNDFSTQNEGLGFIYPYSNLGTGDNLLFDGGLMVGISGNVSDNVRNTGGVDDDFTSLNNVRRLSVPVFSEFDLVGDFNDNNSASPLNVEVRHRAYAWTKAGHRKYVIVEFSIKNYSGGMLNDVYAGIYTDWDIATFSNNVAATDVLRYLGYVYDTDVNGYYAGIQVISNTGFNHYAMFNNEIDDPGGTGVHPNNSYTSADKYTTLSNTVTNAGGSGADVSNVVSSGPFNIAAGDSVFMAFAIIAGDDLVDLQLSADSAYTMYNPCTDATGTVTTTADNCGSGNGTASVQINFGLQPYTYAWSSGETTSSVTGKLAGDYQVTVTTANGCVDIDTATVTGAPPIEATTSTTQANCGVNDGDATVTVSTGTLPYTYLWDSNAGSQTSSTATNVGAGVYSVTVTDGLGCTNTFTATVSDAGAGTPSGSVDQNVTCNGGSDGQASVSMSGGTPTFTYLWDNGSTTSAATGLSVGDEMVQITDASGCITFATVTITEPLAITATLSATLDNGSGNGTATATGGNGVAPYTYLWDATAQSQTTETATSLGQGTYSVTITDANGCSSIFSVVVGSITGIKNITSENSLHIYPNPNDGRFIIALSNPMMNSYLLEVRNALGQVVYTEQLATNITLINSIDLSSLDKGIYFLAVRGGDKDLIQKIILH